MKRVHKKWIAAGLKRTCQTSDINPADAAEVVDGCRRPKITRCGYAPGFWRHRASDRLAQRVRGSSAGLLLFLGN